ncbi:hypothetical protein [Acanthopleuribacter pedis]|uniref:Transmembrane protein n=1 Tax=Acanthopleuribacter pedis TaxID=442870 RepID=A0A8J7Q889_9BACT|nr:hypothetical protein [Acanthopleuribacter pedis]MBO1318694.1 hypothetical protein [Acanthopleuribacter pedis]
MTKPRFLHAVEHGLRQAHRYPGTVLALYLFQLFASLISLYPFWFLFNRHAERSLIDALPGGLMNGHHLIEIGAAEAGGFQLAMVWLIGCGALALVGNLYLAGGVAVVVARGRGDQPALFRRAGFAFLPRFAILALWMLPFAALIPIAMITLESILTLIYGANPDDQLGGLALQLRLAVLVLAGFALKQLFALARLHMVRNPHRSSLASLAAALVFCFAKFRAVLGFLLIFGTAYALLGFSLFELRPFLPHDGWLLVVLHQLWILLKKGLDVTLTHAEWHLIDAYTDRPAMVGGGMPPVRRLPGL